MSPIFGSVNVIAGQAFVISSNGDLPGIIGMFATIIDAFGVQDTMVPIKIWVLAMWKVAFFHEDILSLTEFHIEDLPASFPKGWTKSSRSRCGDCN